MSTSFTRNLIFNLRSRFENEAAIFESESLKYEQSNNKENNNLLKNQEINESIHPIDSSLILIMHIIDCIASLKYLNKLTIDENALKHKNIEEVSGYNISNEILNGLLSEITKILSLSIRKQWNVQNLSELKLAKAYLSLSKSILNQFPEISERKHPKTGQMLIHQICKYSYGNSFGNEILNASIQACFSSVTTADLTYNALPIHWLMKNTNATVDMLKSLLDIYPAGLQATDNQGLTPIHWGLDIDTPNVELLRFVLNSVKGAEQILKRNCYKGWLPLHYLCSHMNSSSVYADLVNLLIQYYPDGVRKSSSLEWLPIHILVNQSLPNLEALKILIDSDQRTLVSKTVTGHIPLHVAVMIKEPSMSTIKLLVDNHLESISIPDSNGMLPLHLSLATEYPNPSIVTHLLKLFPAAALHANNNGLLPLHLIILHSKQPSFTIVKQLVELSPSSINVSVNFKATTVSNNNEMLQVKGESWTPLTKSIERKLSKIQNYFFEISRPKPTSILKVEKLANKDINSRNEFNQLVALNEINQSAKSQLFNSKLLNELKYVKQNIDLSDDTNKSTYKIKPIHIQRPLPKAAPPIPLSSSENNEVSTLRELVSSKKITKKSIRVDADNKLVLPAISHPTVVLPRKLHMQPQLNDISNSTDEGNRENDRFYNLESPSSDMKTTGRKFNPDF